MPEGQKRNDRLFVARSQVSILLEVAEKALHLVAVAVHFFVHYGGFEPVRAVGNDGLNALLGTRSAGFVAVVRRIGQPLPRLQIRQQGLRLGAMPACPPVAIRRTALPRASVQACILGPIPPRLRPRHSVSGSLLFGRPRVGGPARPSSRAAPTPVPGLGGR